MTLRPYNRSPCDQFETYARRRGESVTVKTARGTDFNSRRLPPISVLPRRLIPAPQRCSILSVSLGSARCLLPSLLRLAQPLEVMARTGNNEVHRRRLPYGSLPRVHRC